MRSALALLVALVVLQPVPARATEPHWLEGTWVVRLSLDPRPRLFDVTKVSRGLLGGWNITATYGYADGKPSPVEVALEGSGDDVEVSFVNAAKSKIFVRRAGDGEMTGSIVSVKGHHGTVTMRRAGGDEVRKAKAALGAPTGTTLFDPETQLAEVKTFLGGVWTGTPGKGSRTHTLDVQNIVLARDGIEVRGTYVVEGGQPGKIKATVGVDGGSLSLHLWTGFNGKVALEEAGADRLTGTFVNREGREMPLTLTRVESRDMNALNGLVLVVTYRPT